MIQRQNFDISSKSQIYNKIVKRPYVLDFCHKKFIRTKMNIKGLTYSQNASDIWKTNQIGSALDQK